MENVGDGDESILLEALLEASAEYYSLDLKKKIKRGQRESIAKGRYCGGQIPYGYKSSDGKLIIDEKTAWVVRYLFEQYAAGVPMKEIIDELKKRGARSRRGCELRYTSFAHVLTNTAYIGKFVYSGEVVEGLCEPMIDEDTFYKVQENVKAAAHAPAVNKGKVSYSLQGKAFCGHCGSPMVGESGRGRAGYTYHYYSCSARKKTHSCTKKNEKKDYLEKYVVEQTLLYVLSPERIQHIAKIIVSQYDNEFSSKKIEETERLIRQLESDLNKLVDTLIDAPKVAHKRIYERMEQLEAQKLSLQDDVTKLRIASQIRFTEEEIQSWLRRFCTGDLSDEDFRQNIIDTFINSIYIYDDRIIIFYNIKGGKQVTHADLSAALEAPSTENGSDLNANAPHVKPLKQQCSKGFLFSSQPKGLAAYRSQSPIYWVLLPDKRFFIRSNPAALSSSSASHVPSCA